MENDTLHTHENDVIFGEKIISREMYDGRMRCLTFHLHKHREGEPREWWAIVRVGLHYTWDGVLDTKPLSERVRSAHHVGKPKYIQRLWDNLK